MSMVLTGNRLWKSVENFSVRALAGVAGERRLQVASYCAPGVSQRSLSACSACPGDYEDPDRTAWTLEPEEDDHPPEEEEADGTSGAGHEDEFPAREG